MDPRTGDGNGAKDWEVKISADVEIDLRPDETLGTLGGFSAGDAQDLLWQLTTRLSYRTDPWLVSGSR